MLFIIIAHDKHDFIVIFIRFWGSWGYRNDATMNERSFYSLDVNLAAIRSHMNVIFLSLNVAT